MQLLNHELTSILCTTRNYKVEAFAWWRPVVAATQDQQLEKLRRSERAQGRKRPPKRIEGASKTEARSLVLEGRLEIRSFNPKSILMLATCYLIGLSTCGWD